jgi:hypothetical protein
MPQRQRAWLVEIWHVATLVRQSVTECRLSALWPLSAAEHSPEECSQSRKVLAREPTDVAAIPTSAELFPNSKQWRSAVLPAVLAGRPQP